MATSCVTNDTTTLEAIVNPINAACHKEFVPNRLYIIENPKVTDKVAQAVDLATEIVDAYGGDELGVRITSIDSELDFERLYAHERGDRRSSQG